MHPSFGPSANWDRLEQRARLLTRLRGFFADRGFLEVETPILSADVVVDKNLDPISLTLFDDPSEPSQGRKMWLQTSPEFCMKRLLAAGSPEAIYQVAKAFRGGERGRLHNPEFTIVEWYRVHDDYHDGMDLLADLVTDLLPARVVQRTSYRDAFQRHTGLDPFRDATARFEEYAKRESPSAPPELPAHDRDLWLNYLLAQFVEPRLGTDVPEILFDYPGSQAALARVRLAGPEGESQTAAGESWQVAERFELYMHGVELANGYHELLDPDLLVARNRENNASRRADGRPQLPESSQLLAAMKQGLPACTGVALGFDRLAMIACGAVSIDEVIAFPIDRA